MGRDTISSDSTCPTNIVAFRQPSMLSPDRTALDRPCAALWQRLYQRTAGWNGVSDEGISEFFLCLKASEAFPIFMPRSIVTFRSPYHFVVMEHVFGSPFTRVLVMNQLQANSLRDPLNFVAYARSLWLPLGNTAPVGNNLLDACSIVQAVASEGSMTSSPLPTRQQIGPPRPQFSIPLLDQHGSSDDPVPQELLEWNDMCFGMDDAESCQIMLQLEDCGVYTSPGGFNSAGSSSLLSDAALELAMDITEQIALLSDAPGPIPTDMPLLFIRLTQQALSDLHSWLQASYDWHADITYLLTPNLSAEVLAWEIMGYPLQLESDWSSPVRAGNKGVEEHLNTLTSLRALPVLNVNTADPLYAYDTYHKAEVTNACRCSTPKTTPAIVAYSKDEILPLEIITSPEVVTCERRTRLKPKIDLSIVVYPNTELPAVEIVSSQITAGSDSPSVLPPTIPKDEVEMDIGMAPYSTWNGGKKASILAGLFALGAILSPSPRSPLSPFSAALHDVRSPPQPRRSILSPWLDVVHIHGFEPAPSPWIVDQSEASPSSLFPQSPVVF